MITPLLIAAAVVLLVCILTELGKVKSSLSDVRRLQERLLKRLDTAVEQPAPEAAPEPPAPAQPAPVRPRAAVPPPLPEPAAPKPAAAAWESPPAPEKPDLEVALGARVASYVGIAALVIGVAFFVGYAIQHNLIGPLGRVLAGLGAGAALVVTGCAARRRSERFTILARALVGGGSALFYFSVFAAHSMYHLIGTAAAGAGLVFSAAVTLRLATAFDSQAVALLGVVGAFITPMLIGDYDNPGLFPLAYVAVVNVPVLAVGVRRNWQTLFFAAFLFTAAIATAWMARNLPEAWRASLGFSVVFYVEFVALALLQARTERDGLSRGLDIVRLLSSSFLLLLALNAICDSSGLEHRRGLIFFAAAAAHLALARATWVRGAVRDEGAVFIASGVLFAALAVPAQWKGHWVALAWAAEGAVASWTARRAEIRWLLGAGFALGVAAVVAHLALNSPAGSAIILNAHFLAGASCCALLVFQGTVASAQDPRSGVIVFLTAIASSLLVGTVELSRAGGDWSGSLVTIFWAAGALLLALAGLKRRRAYLRYAGLGLFTLTVLKVFFVDLADLRGLGRIAAFFGVGVLLLLLSYAYQKVAPRLLGEEEDKP